MARRKKGRRISGWVILDKPFDMGSTQAVGKVRWLFQAQKAGHAGTLDPLATGMLPVALGEATKTVPYVMDGMKTYRFTVKWGTQTTTDDGEGDTVATSNERPAGDAIEVLLPRYLGEIEQMPPDFSALKIDGVRAYDLARAGEKVELQPRIVFIERFKLIERPDQDTAIFEVDCGKGTYVRSLARDLGRDLGCYGHVSALRRVCVAPFDEADLVDLETLVELQGDLDALDDYLVSTGAALCQLPSIEFAQDPANRIRLGNPVLAIGRDAPVYADEICATHLGDVIAIGSVEKGMFRPRRVFNN